MADDLPEMPPCPYCAVAMVVKQNRRTENYFLGCPRWPNCTGTRNIERADALKVVRHREALAAAAKNVSALWESLQSDDL